MIGLYTSKLATKPTFSLWRISSTLVGSPSLSLSKFGIHTKVSVLGASGGIGQPLSLLLKLNPLVDELALYDIRHSIGVGSDLSHIDTPSKVKGYLGDENGLKECLSGSKVVVVPAGVPRKPGMTRDDLFNTNASIVYNLAKNCAKYCPDASLLIISNPVNSTVPICARVFEINNLKTNRIYGVTTLDLVRASRFISEKTNARQMIKVPVVGGHSGQTIVPLFSQVEGQSEISSIVNSKEELEAIVNRIQFGGDEVVKAKEGTGSATLSMAHAGAKFANSILRSIKNKDTVEEIAFVKNQDGTKINGTEIEYISTKITINGENGVQKIFQYQNITEYEQQLMNVALEQLQKNINKGKKFVEEQEN